MALPMPQGWPQGWPRARLLAERDGGQAARSSAQQRARAALSASLLRPSIPSAHPPHAELTHRTPCSRRAGPLRRPPPLPSPRLPSFPNSRPPRPSVLALFCAFAHLFVLALALSLAPPPRQVRVPLHGGQASSGRGRPDQKPVKPFLSLPPDVGITRSTLKRTVLDSGLRAGGGARRAAGRA